MQSVKTQLKKAGHFKPMNQALKSPFAVFCGKDTSDTTELTQQYTEEYTWDMGFEHKTCNSQYEMWFSFNLIFIKNTSYWIR